MSFDPNPNQPPMGNVAPQKSSKKWWIFGGVGCFTLLLLCGGGLGIAAWFGMDIVLNNPGIKSATASIESSAELEELLGAPVTAGSPELVGQKPAGGQVSYDYKIPVNGANKTGTATVTAKGTPFGDDWVTENLEVTVDGEVIKLDSIDDLDLDIDAGN